MCRLQSFYEVLKLTGNLTVRCTQRFLTCVSADCFSAPVAECFPLNWSRRVYYFLHRHPAEWSPPRHTALAGAPLLVFAVCLFSCFHFTDDDHVYDELKLESCLVGYCRFSLRVEELSQGVEERRLKGLSFIHNYCI